MPTQYPNSPRLLKGALVAYESQEEGPGPNIIVFQYNPEQLSRTLAHRVAPREASNVGGAREDVLRVQGPPVETIALSILLNAADQLADRHPTTVALGLYPALAALEMLLYPPSAQVTFNRTLTKAGTAQICAADVPLVLFVWGPSRVVPVRLTSFSITEEAFDPRLNPIQARVELGMQVLTYMELKESTIGYNAYLATQIQKEVFASMNGDATATPVGPLPF
jgi:hypothetical protein